MRSVDAAVGAHSNVRHPLQPVCCPGAQQVAIGAVPPYRPGTSIQYVQPLLVPVGGYGNGVDKLQGSEGRGCVAVAGRRLGGGARVPSGWRLNVRFQWLSVRERQAGGAGDLALLLPPLPCTRTCSFPLPQLPQVLITSPVAGLNRFRPHLQADQGCFWHEAGMLVAAHLAGAALGGAREVMVTGAP